MKPERVISPFALNTIRCRDGGRELLELIESMRRDDVAQLLFEKLQEACGEPEPDRTAMVEAVLYYTYGRVNELPSSWERRYREIKHENDPEWAEYQRLKKKFEGVT